MKSITTLIVAFALSQTIHAEKPTQKPLKVFILAGQSNMQGQGMVTSQDEQGQERPGTLLATLKDRTKAKQLKHLVNAKGEWAEKRDDVWIYDVSELGQRHGPLEFGYGWDLGSRIWFGPELQFGHVVGERLENRVLIIKTAWGGRDLFKDFRPPSAGGTVGPLYTEMIGTVKKVLGSLDTQFPEIRSGSYELAGFVWWHGWNDYCSPTAGAPAYEENLTHLIHDVRRDLNVPKLPCIIGEFTGPWGADCEDPTALVIRKAQKKVADKPEFADSVKFVETHDFVRKAENSPSDETYHEFKNGETYFLVGDALGKAMVGLLGK